MKTAVIFAIACVVFVQGLSDEQKEKMKKHVTDCMKETRVEQPAVLKLKNNDFSAPTPELKQYVACIMTKSELMTKDGKFRKDIALAKVPNPADKPEVEKLIDTCLAKTTSKDAPNLAWEYASCYQKNKPKHSLF